MIIFAGVTVLHIALILLVAFNIETIVKQSEPSAGVMKLVDLEEEIPPPPEEPPVPQSTTQEPIAENVIETDEEPPPVTAPVNPVQQYVVPEQVEYLPQHMITKVPVFPEDQIRRNTIYPRIARESNIEGTAYLALFIDREGNIRDIRILREDPPNRGFGEAAVNAFRGIRVTPAESNGVPVGVQWRYPIRFVLR